MHLLISRLKNRRFVVISFLAVASIALQLGIVAAGNNQASAQGYGARNYYFPWYDSQFGQTWVLGAVPQDGTAKSLDVYLRDMNSGLMELLTPDPMIVNAGETRYLEPNGMMGGPVKVITDDGNALISERSLYGNSFEEVWATPYEELDSHYYWPTYFSWAGMQTWILISNPAENGEPVQVDLSIKTGYFGYTSTDDIVAAGADQAPGGAFATLVTYLAPPQDIFEQKIIEPGESWAPMFANTSGMPVEVKAYRVDGSPDDPADARKIIASERTLAFGSFNEMPGIPASNLSDRYFWTWYDGMHGSDSVVVGNPSQTEWIWIELTVGDYAVPIRPVPPGAIYPWSGYMMDGPVEVRGCADQHCNAPADIFATQMIHYGYGYSYSTEETAGTPVSDLTPEVNWTWYDMQTPGVSDWVMIANPDETTEIYWELTIQGADEEEGCSLEGLCASGTLAPGDSAAPTLPGVMGGPVQVKAWAADSNKTVPMDVMASQRVLWNGYFNEIVGKGL